MNKVTDAGIQQWAEKHGLTSRTIREAYEEAARQPAKPEAVRLRDELRERAEFEAWADGRFTLDRAVHRTDRYYWGETQNAWEAWQAALAATGKQQVGEVQGERRSPAEIAAILRAMASNYSGGHSWDHLDSEVCVQAADALAARQPMASNQVVEKVEQLDVDSSPAQGVDLGQFIALAKFGEEFAFSAEKQPHSRVVYSQASRLLALIDGQEVKS